MIPVDSRRPGPDFVACAEAAAAFIEARFFEPNKKKENFVRWTKFIPQPPYLEHLSFRIGNQLFFVRIVDIDGNMMAPGMLDSVLLIAHECRGHPLILSMRNTNGEWAPTFAKGEEFFHAATKEKIDPLKLVTNEKIEMTDWEVHDYAVQVVRDKMHEAGAKIVSWQCYPEIEPAILFTTPEYGLEWVVVRAVRYPAEDAPPPENFLEIHRSCRPISGRGYFASVAIANAKDSFGAAASKPTPLYRGEPLQVKYGMRAADDIEIAVQRSIAP